MREWIEPEEVQLPPRLLDAAGGNRLVAETLVRRGLADAQAVRAFLDPAHYCPASPSALPDMDAAVERLTRAIRQKEIICVWGDFDVDGQTATAILVSTLRDLGAATCYHIPHRERESHGIALPALKRLVAEGTSLVLTCDTGVTAHEAIAYARSQGVDVIITDHHDLPPRLPEAAAVVNPKRLPDMHPLRELPGVGCAYKLAEALYEWAGQAGEAERYLDLAALGIVADVAVQAGDVRYLLQKGLAALRRAERVGLRALMEIAGLSPSGLTEEHIGFELAPRLNALGRLDDASAAVEFLITDDPERARILATELEGLNARRKLLVSQVLEGALAQIERDPSLLEGGALVLSHPAWHPGVIGIVAGRLAERYNRPVVLIAAPPGGLGRGSARSVPGCNITAALAAHADLLLRFGGHPMAAGLSIAPERIPELQRALSRTVREMCGETIGKAMLQIDGFVDLADLSLDLVEQIERLAPFGPGNPPLVLASRGLVLAAHSPLGRYKEHLQAIVEDEHGASQRVVWWQGAGEPLPEGRFDLAYTVRASDYRGQRSVQVEWVDARLTEALLPALRLPRTPHVVDHRQDPNPRVVLEALRAQEGVCVWSEADARAEIGGCNRSELSPARALVVWTTPPGPAEWRAALERVAPEWVYLFAADPGLDQLDRFLERLAGLVKYALNVYGGRTHVSALATSLAHREATVRVGLAWLAAHGDIVLKDDGVGELHMTLGVKEVGDDLDRQTEVLRALLEETAAYRAYFRRADGQTLVSMDPKWSSGAGASGRKG